MKIASLTLLVAIGAAVRQAQGADCITDFDPSTDYFEDKAQVSDSTFWEVEYHNYYKIVTSTARFRTSYLLYQCGSTPPADQEGLHNATIEIPVSEVAIESTPMIGFMEQLNLRDEIAVFLTNTSYISSPCFLDDVESGEVQVPDSTSEVVLGSDGESFPVDMVAFVGPWSSFTVKNQVNVAEYFETTNAAIFEWVKYFSLFFNAEKVANEVVAAASERYDCIATNAAAVQTDMAGDKPKVLWGQYFEACQAWTIGSCPNYYCEYADACAVDMIETTETGSLDTCGTMMMSTDEFVEVGKDADYFFFLAPYWDTTYEMFKDKLDQMKSVKNQKVYDYQGSGSNGWFESRPAEYYNVVRDYCSVVGTTSQVPGRSWFRNVFNEGIKLEEECTAESESNILSEDFECSPTVLAPPPDESSAFGKTVSSIVAAAVLLVAVLI